MTSYFARCAYLHELREAIVSQRQRDASVTREAVRRNKLTRDQMMLEQGAGVKAVHDNIYRSKYVPPDSAELLTGSKYGKSTST